jgi:hypothetical protein
MPKTRAWRSNQKIWKVKKTWTCAIFINSNSTHTLQASNLEENHRVSQHVRSILLEWPHLISGLQHFNHV